jgi:integrase
MSRISTSSTRASTSSSAPARPTRRARAGPSASHGRHQETCPVHALRRWFGIAELESGPLWPAIVPNGRPGTTRRSLHGRAGRRRLSPQAIAGVVQRAAQRAGLDPREFAGHSLRAGFAIEAAAQGASERAIMRQTGHRSVEMMRRYIREGDRYRDNAAALLGL